MAEIKGNSTFWDRIVDLLDDQMVSYESLMKGIIYRLLDSVTWLRDEMVRNRAAFASQVLGSPAKLVGSADLTTLVYDDTSGTLNGLVLQVQTDNSGVKTVTFGQGPGKAPKNPGDVIVAIQNVTTGNPLASIDAAGHLNLASLTTGAAATIKVIGGSALQALGFQPGISDTGKSFGNSGAEMIGVPPFSGFGGGTLLTALQNIFAIAAPAYMIPSVITWAPTMGADDGSAFYYITAPAAAGGTVILSSKSAKPGAPPGAPPRAGTMMFIRRTVAGPPNISILVSNENAGGSNICTLTPGTGASVILFWNTARKFGGATIPGWSLLLAGNGCNVGSDAD